MSKKSRRIGAPGVDSNTYVITAAGTKLKLRTPGATMGNGSFISFSNNDYLNFSMLPSIIDAGKQALDKYGASPGNSRRFYGYLDIHRDLEEEIALFHTKEDAIIFHSGMDANLSLFTNSTTSDDVIFSDEFNHRSIILGLKLSNARKVIYDHINMIDLEKKLSETTCKGMRFIITDGIFSMDGDIAPLNLLHLLSVKYNAHLFVDESHAVGCIGKTGRGCEEYFGLEGCKNIIITSSMGKAIGASGGYVTGSKEVLDKIYSLSPVLRYTHAVSPAVAASALQGLKEIANNPIKCQEISAKARRFRAKAVAVGFKVTGNVDHPICPVVLNSDDQVLSICKEMKRRAILLMGVIYPLIPKDVSPRLRFVITLGHTNQEIDNVIQTLKEISNSSTNGFSCKSKISKL